MSVPKTPRTPAVRVEDVSRAILVLRGHKVLLDTELAALYGVSAKRFNEQVRRNRNRFPADFMFQLTADESRALRSQFATLKSGRGQHRKYLPYAFTEQGVSMLSSVLRSARAIAVNIQIMRAFVRMRELLISNRELAEKLDQLEARLEKKLASHDKAIAAILSAIRELMNPTPPRRRGIGFTADLGEK
jgi:phage regulator Rha-like protein